MRLRHLFLLLFFLTIAGCDGYPKDVEGTTQRVRQSGTVRTGVIADARQDRSGADALARAVGASAGASPEFQVGSAEDLIRDLDEGRLDLVVGRFATSSPWKSHAAFSKPYRAESPPDEKPVLRAVVRKGENRWLMLVAGAVAGGKS